MKIDDPPCYFTYAAFKQVYRRSKLRDNGNTRKNNP